MISVDWVTKIVTIPKSYLSLVSGTLYTMDTDQFLTDLRDLEADGDEGICYPTAATHNAEYEAVGVTYARAVLMHNGYSVTFEDDQYTVRLEGSNNNIFDVAGGILNQNQVQVIPTNSAGLITVATGAVTPSEIRDAVWDAPTADHKTADTYGNEVLTKKKFEGLK
jgi:hypothetical protein